MFGITPDLLVGGDAEAVGIRYYSATKDHPPMRVLYPASLSSSSTTNTVGWFNHEGGIVPFLSGFVHAGVAKHDTKLFRFLLVPLLYAIVGFLPAKWMKLPGVYKNAPLCLPSFSAPDATTTEQQQKVPFIVFSHGLTGTGQENLALCAAWAKQGYVVAVLHHTDASSCRVQLADGTIQWYDSGPPFSNYNRNFRPNQVQHRAKEVVQACQFVTSSACELAHVIDKTRIVAAGFSYGAATVARAVVMDDADISFCGAILLDGWFYIDVQSAGVEFEFPQEAFQRGGLQIPSLFVGSQQFERYPKLMAATQKLAGSGTNENDNNNAFHILPGTSHQNFCDFVFWAPTSLMQRIGVIGPTPPEDAFQQIVQLSNAFLRKVTSPQQKQQQQ